MKSFKVIFIIFCSLLISCNKKQEEKKGEKNNDTIVIYNVNELSKYEGKNVKVIDTSCINQEKRALSDIKKGKLVYYCFIGMTEMFKSNEEMKQILSKYNIQIDSVFTYCTPLPKGFKRNCYVMIMNKEIDKKYGNKFINSLRVLAEKQYVKNHPNKIFQYAECDTVSSYPGVKKYWDGYEKLKEDFARNFVYPKGYQYKKEKNFSSTDVSFILTKDGKISKIETDCSFANSENEKFAGYFKTNAENFIKKVKWIPAKYQGINVNSEMHFCYFHK